MLGAELSSLGLEDFVRGVALGEGLLMVGEGFGHQEGKELRALLRTHAKSFFDK